MRRLMACAVTLTVCYLAACFVLWEFPLRLGGGESEVPRIWIFSSAAIAAIAAWLAGRLEG